MIQLTNVLMALLAASSATAALAAHEPIKQNRTASTQPWEYACREAHGGSSCRYISVIASSSLRSHSARCDQQRAADMMVDLAKTLNSTPMIQLAQIFVQQPRNERNGLQVPYCQKPPKNAELRGLYHCQFSGSDFTKFSGHHKTGHLPPGVSAVVPPGSCPSYNSSVPNGMQLYKLLLSPRKPQINRHSIVSRGETSTDGCCDDDDDDDHPDTGPFHHNGSDPTLNTHNTGPSHVTPFISLSNGTVHTPSVNVSISSLLNNGTTPSGVASLFSDLVSSGALSSSPSPVPGNILRRAKKSGLKHAKPEHIPSKSQRVKPRPKQKQKQVRSWPEHFSKRESEHGHEHGHEHDHGRHEHGHEHEDDD